MSGSKWERKPNTGDGVLFWEDEKKSDRAPDAKGSAVLDVGMLKLLIEQAKAGQEIKIEISAWNRKTRAGKDMMSLSLQMPYQRDGAGGGTTLRQPVTRMPPKAPPVTDDLGDDIPF